MTNKIRPKLVATKEEKKNTKRSFYPVKEAFLEREVSPLSQKENEGNRERRCKRNNYAYLGPLNVRGVPVMSLSHLL